MTGSETSHSQATPRRPQRNVWNAIKHGWSGRCPHCGDGCLFRAFLKPVDSCADCYKEMHHQRADDLPPYLVIFVVSHIVVGAYLLAESVMVLNSWQHLAIWAPIKLLMMQPAKGAVIGLQWANYMHGFGGQEGEAEMVAGD